jgi:hypothetical protein
MGIEHEVGSHVSKKHGEEFDWKISPGSPHRHGHVEILNGHPLDSDKYYVIKGTTKHAKVIGSPGKYKYNVTWDDGSVLDPHIIIS